MSNLIRLGDTTDHGGEVITASDTMRYGGRRVARADDLVKCPLHPELEPNAILEGDNRITDHGVPVARQGHLTTCGCRLVSSLISDTSSFDTTRAPGAGV
ncbi:putative Zn-binding protein involved in type VI secretion [Paraburkholderia sp. BL18I3N2]|uniref:PAAR domain-containing protein n=1 Tax=Paraburkholderia sp. BL18I3N2 TaxID=1938799 RepID=UPI000D07F040|nr:PAAR domain-containing protein [Paraburkholderia sp. BL18I3N2]PRX28063.1 putative Zn-binding protein involved in type VI secretion [Paraburkholderia sp. BL18I3N2]